MLEPPDYIDWDMACVHCGKELGDEDEIAALHLQRIGESAYLRSLCARCAAHQKEHPADGRWIDAGDLPQELGLWVVPPA